MQLAIGDLFAGATAFLATLAGQWLLTTQAQRLGLIDHPAGRKDHAHPTPVTGGIAMLAGVVIAGIFLVADAGPASLGFTLAAVMVIALGALDDRYDLPWTLRIAVQATAVLVMVYVGGIRIEQLGDIFGLGTGSLGALSVPFTVFAAVGVINALNMIDGADGLAGLLALCALVMLEAAALYAGNGSVAHHVPILIGAVAGFLILNLRFPWQPRARIFMGDAGSGFLGLAIACFAVRLTQNTAHPVSPVLGLWLITVPLVDCLVLMTRRFRSKQSPFAADRNHIHHLMIESGFGPTQAAIALALFTCFCGLLVGCLMRLHVPHVLLLLGFIGLCIVWYWATASRTRAIRFFRWLHSATSVFQRKAELAPRDHAEKKVV
jgi:UDP-GlcNAc:undecaprenyl-phosphate GlcNAc-1-phosphate transferase